MAESKRASRFRVVRRTENSEPTLENFQAESLIKRPQRNEVRQKSGIVSICGGTLRGRKLRFPSAPGLRPTVAKAREMIFSWLQQDVTNYRILDLYAGSGILSFESASRGANSLVLIDKNTVVADQLALNANLLDINNVEVKELDVEHYINSADEKGVEPFDLIFIDPPYQYKNAKQILMRLCQSTLLTAETQIIIESHRNYLRNTDVSSHFHIHKLKLMGSTTIMLLQPKFDDPKTD